MTISLRTINARMTVAVAGLLLCAAGSAKADPACGEVLVQSIALTADLACNGPQQDGLVIAGDGVTLDLNGHVISGSGAAGVRIVGPNATVTNTAVRPGVIRGFEYGVYLNPTHGATVSGLTVTANGGGIAAGFADGNVISGNMITGNTRDGIRLGVSSHNAITDNTVSKNDLGIALADGSNDNVVAGNDVSKNRNFGVCVFCNSDGNVIADNSVTNTTGGGGHGIIVRSGSDWAEVTGNGANRNEGDGIRVDDGYGCASAADNVAPIGTVIADNAANRNGDDGIEVATEGVTTVRDNTANGNGDYGIEAPNTEDGGGNVAVTNKGPAQTVFGGG
jgi:parallel beta-helix repeat protein